MSKQADRTKFDANLARVIELTEQLEARKALYEELDRVTLELQEAGFDRAILHGKEVILRDNFAEKNVQWRMAAVRRFEAVVKDMPGAAGGSAPKKRAKPGGAA